MIQSFAHKYKKTTAYLLFVLFYLQTIILPLHAAVHSNVEVWKHSNKNTRQLNKGYNNNYAVRKKGFTNNQSVASFLNIKKSPEKINIGGPSSPEASSFKAIGSDNLVNLFTGDFSYSIPLLDVGGYPVNLFYTGGITMEQEASWVGLGWNINPGTVSRNMRGVPDDFNGDDKLIQTQNVKPNRTWGGEVGIDGEMLGWKAPKLNFSLGYSYNNYLGPAIEVGAGISLNIPITENIKYDKEANKRDTTTFGTTVGVNGKLSSRSGLTFSPSLNANLEFQNKKDALGVGISTSYNSRNGIKDLNLSMSTTNTYKYKYGKDNAEEGKYKAGLSLGSSSISFARPSYMPTLKMPMKYSNYSGQIEFGAGMFGLRGALHGQGYYSESKIPDESKVIYKPLVGFIYSENANGNKDAVMDLNRLGDAEVTPNTPIISAPQYAYDIFSIQGEGTGGTIRAYRGDMGFMRDNETTSKDNNFSLGGDIAPGGHWGGNWNIIQTPTRAGGWEDNNNTLRQTLSFKTKVAGSDFENVYFRNPGEATVTDTSLFKRIGGDDLVRFKLSGSNVNPRLETSLEQFSKKTVSYKQSLPIDVTLPKRDKRTQVTTFLTAADASKVGLDTVLKNYTGSFDINNNIVYSTIQRDSGFRKKHHISEIDVLEQTGMRYVYGIPVYNIKQKDYTFSVDNTGNPNTGITTFSADEPTISSHHMANKDKLDGYMMSQETPAYASSFLLSGLLSPDYVDVTGDGITEDDLGGSVKFNYNKTGTHKWRTPRNNTTASTAHFNDGLKSEKKDNKATISYGEREVWYLNSIESKSMIAIFKTENRDDAKGVKDEMDGRADANDNSNKRLKQIDLYTKAEIKAKGIANAKPIKSVYFKYSYSLCKGTPDNLSGNGKLTLDSIYFTYNGQPRAKKDKYVFNYGNTSSVTDNPLYANKASDKWGTYKDPNTDINTNPAANPGGLTNDDFPFTANNKAKDDQFAAAWSLKKILLPSGGQMEIQYEADDYGYVQDRRACNMFNIYGLGNSSAATQENGLYQNGLSSADNYYVYVKLPQPLQNTDPVKQKQEIMDKYLEGINQLAFKLLVKMPKDFEPLTVYANYDDYGLCSNSTNKDIIYIKLRPVDGKSPLSKSAIGFLTENIPGQAFEGYDVEISGIPAFLEMMGAMLTNLKNAFSNVDEQMRSASPPKARTIALDRSFVRLDNPLKMKYGGGVRVKRVLVKDNWNKMTNQFTSTYGQDYEYTTTEKINGQETTISSGVASYEPGLGSEENPFREIIAFSNKMPLASAQYGAIEMPILEGFYPSPGVGYSKVTVRSIHRKGTHGDSTLRSAIGKQVTEYYTAKDYPCYSAYTPLNSMDYHRNTFGNILYKDITDRKVVSQGFLVETNDMHGKIKLQIAYSESDEKTPLSYSYHTYKNTGKNGLNDKVNFTNNIRGGVIAAGNMGIDMELMTDVREFSVKSSGFNGQIQSDWFSFTPPIFVLPMLPLRTYTENKYRAVTCTKLINYHAIEDSVIVMDKGSVISTKTTVYDAETGSPIVTKTANEFNDPIYNVNYPAYWAYSGMEPAYKNIDRQFSDVSFNDGVITIPGLNSSEVSNIFESGDELYIMKGSNSTSCVPSSAAAIKKIWAYDPAKNYTSLTNKIKSLVFIDKEGKRYTRDSVSFRIVRSGKRNNLGQSVFSATSLENPIALHNKFTTNPDTLIVTNKAKVVATSAVQFKEKWQTDNDVFKRYSLTAGPSGDNLIVNGNFENYSSNPDFSTDNNYTYSAPPSDLTVSGNYGFALNASYANASWPNCRPHTTNGGYMMVVNGSTQNGAFWKKTVNVLPNTDYVLSAWFTAFSTTNLPSFQVKINGVAVGSNLSMLTSCTWRKYSETWNSGSNTTATITITDLTTASAGNDFGVDDISLLILNDCSSNEEESCSGYLERNINPYLKGLIGNFKPHRSYVFYGERMQSDANVPTAIRKDGVLKDFSNYWAYDFEVDAISNYLMPAQNNTNWVWNSELTKVNSKGQELETKDALNRYTAAQYGFAKNMPVTMTQNARYGESFAESFEDDNYKERINSGSNENVCDSNKYINFTGLSNGKIVNTDTLNVKAHSGKNVLAVNANSQVVKILKVTSSVADNFNMQFSSGSILGPGQSGAVIYRNPAVGNSNLSYGTTTFGNVSMSASQQVYGISDIEYREQSEQYVHAPVNGYYSFTLKASYGGATELLGAIRSGIGIKLTNLKTGQEYYMSESVYTLSENNYEALTYTLFLKCGDYKIFSDGYGSSYDNNGHHISTSFGYESYDGLTSKVITCTYTKPIPATEEMLNPVFSLQANKKMLFSAWVRQGCDTPCYKTDFDKSTIEIWSGGNNIGATSIKRTGAIIEGWQKIEGEFTVPSNDTTAEIKFINTNSAPMYVDDIRIHPFNANMKSYVYDSRTLRLSAELDENNFTSFYEYNEEGQLVRVKKETSQGIKTINETRSAKQKVITEVQQ